MLEIDKMFKDDRTKYIVNDKKQSKSILFNPPKDELELALKEGRLVTAEEWDAFITKGERKNGK